MRRLVASAVLAFALFAAGPASWAYAAPPSVAPSLIDVQFWTEDVGPRSALIVIAIVPTSTPLPVSVDVPLPLGAEVTWAGEIFPDAANDVSQTPVVAKDKLSLRLIAEKSRTLQYEALTAPYTDKAGRRIASLPWVQSVPAGKERFSVKLPRVSADAKLTPAAKGKPFVDPDGAKVYTLPEVALKAGEKHDVTADYAPQLPSVPKPKSVYDYILPATVALLAIAAIALFVLITRSRQTTNG